MRSRSMPAVRLTHLAGFAPSLRTVRCRHWGKIELATESCRDTCRTAYAKLARRYTGKPLRLLL